MTTTAVKKCTCKTGKLHECGVCHVERCWDCILVHKCNEP